MKKFIINVNGKSYDVEVCEVTDGVASIPVQAAAPVAAPKAPQTAQAAPAAPANGTSVTSPMPGTILKVNVSNGQAVKKGDVLFVLEAMKMENEIMAPCDGTVSAVSVANGASVENGTVLCTLA